MWERFSRKEQDLGALQKVLKRFRSPSARREGLIIVYRGNAVRLGFVVLLILVIGSLAFWLLRRRTREEEAALTTPPPPEEDVVVGEEVGPSVEEAVEMPSGSPLAEDTTTTTAREAPPPGEERPERRGISRRISLGWPRRPRRWRRGSPPEG